MDNVIQELSDKSNPFGCSVSCSEWLSKKRPLAAWAPGGLKDTRVYQLCKYSCRKNAYSPSDRPRLLQKDGVFFTQLPIQVNDAFDRAAWWARAEFWIETGLPDSFEIRRDFLLMYCGL